MRQPINQAGTTVIQPSIKEDQLVDAETTAGQRWKVIAHDDNFTTMEFVVRIMVQIFKKPLVFAEAIMWQVHNEGHSVVDVLPKAEAEHRVRKATAAARLEGFPFRLTIEPDE
jgi:ATP-dependent Clp protease adaptor protein ClpS